MSDVILQQEPTYNRCQNIWDGICVLRTLVEQLFNGRDFQYSALAELLPCDAQLRVGNAVTTIPQTKAFPEITMTRSDINFTPCNAQSIMTYGSSVVQPGFSLIFEIKTTTYRTTELMALELSQFLITITPYVHGFGLNLAGVVCGQTKLFRDTTPNYYFSKVTVNCSLPQVAWKYKELENILRSITITLSAKADGLQSVMIN